MNFTSVPIVVVCCYVVGEIYKAVFKNKTEAYKFIPVLLAAIGGALGVVMFFTNPEMIFNVENAWVALGIGIVSGVSATGANQIVKQLFGKRDGELQCVENNGDEKQSPENSAKRQCPEEDGERQLAPKGEEQQSPEEGVKK